MISNLRDIAVARREIPATVVDALRPLEVGSLDQAIGVSALKTLLLISHGEAALPVAVGAEVLRLVNEAAYHAEQHRAKIGELHEALRPIASEFFPFSGPECPPNEGRVEAEPRAVA